MPFVFDRNYELFMHYTC